MEGQSFFWSRSVYFTYKTFRTGDFYCVCGTDYDCYFMIFQPHFEGFKLSYRKLEALNSNCTPFDC